MTASCDNSTVPFENGAVNVKDIRAFAMQVLQEAVRVLNYGRRLGLDADTLHLFARGAERCSRCAAEYEYALSQFTQFVEQVDQKSPVADLITLTELVERRDSAQQKLVAAFESLSSLQARVSALLVS